MESEENNRMINSSASIMRKPLVMKLWEHHPNLWKYVINLGIFIKYKTLNIQKLPSEIKLNGESIIFIDSSENRGRALLLKEGVTQNRLTLFWSTAIQIMHPDLVLDVGVNYGECIFSASYPSNCTIVGVEANQRLIHFIEKSRNRHSNKDQIHLVHGFASDCDKEEKLFFVDKNWSGTSSGIHMKHNKATEIQKVPSFKMDSLLSGLKTEGKSVLFKIDVEGYESFVLNGMKRTIEDAEEAAGFIEFDSAFMKNSGVSLRDFFDGLLKHFEIYAYDTDDSVLLIDHNNIEDWIELCQRERIHTDILLIKGQNFIEELAVTLEK